MSDIGQVTVAVLPNSDGFVNKLRGSILPQMDQFGSQSGARFGDSFNTEATRRIQAALRNLPNGDPAGQGRQSGQKYADAFDSAVLPKISAALKSLPDITVGANTSPADAKLAEIRTQLLALTGDDLRLSVSDSDALLKITELRGALAELSKSDDIRVKINATEAEAQLAALKAQLAGTTTGLNDLTAAASKSGQSGEGFPLMGLAIAGAVTAIGPLTAAAFGAATELGALGAAGLLAFEGIKTEMANGTVQGHQFTGEISGLKTALAGLESTAAANAGGGILAALGELNKFAPTLDPVVARLGQHLGDAAKISVGGLTAGLQTMTPLLDEAGVDADTLATKFAAFAKSEEFSRFVAYASQELPIVGHDLADLGSAAVHLGVVLQPVGDSLLSIIDLAAKGADAAAKLLALTKVSSSPILVGDKAATQLEQITAAADLNKKSVQALGGGYTSLSATIKTAYDPSVLQKFNNVGLSLSPAASWFGIDSATKSASKFFKSYDDGLTQLASEGKTAQANDALKLLSDESGVSIDKLLTKLPTFKAEMDALGVSTAALTPAQTALVKALGTSPGAYQTASTAIAQTATQLAATTLQMQLQNSASGLLKASLDALDGKNLASAQALNAFQQALVSQAKATTSADAALTGMSSSAIRNRGNLLNLVTAAETAAGAQGDVANSSITAKTKLADLRQQIIDNAVAHGEDRQAVTDYINTVLNINDLKIKPTQFDIDDAPARAKVAAFQKWLSSLTTKIDVEAVTGYSNIAKSGSVYQYATGGHVSGPGTGTSDSVLARLSNGEFVVNAKSAAQHRALLESINAKGYADGGIVSLTPKQSTASYGSSTSELTKLSAAATAAAKAVAALAQTAASNSKANISSATNTVGADTATAALYRVAAGDQAKAGDKTSAQADIDAANNLLAKAKALTSSLKSSLKDDTQSVLKNILGSADQVGTTMHKLLADTATAAANGIGDQALVKRVRTATTQLEGLATERATITARITADNQQLTTDTDSFNSEVSSISQATTGGLGITSITAPAASTGAVSAASYDPFSGTAPAASTAASLGGPGLTVDSILSQLSTNAGVASKFQSNIASLQSLGVSQNIIEQLAGEGASQGGQLASTLLSASPAQIAQLNASDSSLTASGNGIGQQLAQQLFGSSIANDRNVLSHDTNNLKAVNDKADQIAKSVTDALGKIGIDVTVNNTIDGKNVPSSNVANIKALTNKLKARK